MFYLTRIIIIRYIIELQLSWKLNLTKPQKEIFHRRQEEGYVKYPTTFTISIFAYLTKRARLSYIQDEAFYYLSSFSIMASIFLSKLSN
jgi:hypothetical protein